MVVGDAGLHPVEHRAHRAPAVAVGQVDAEDGRGLGEAIAFEQGHPEELLEPRRERRAQGLAARDGELQRPQLRPRLLADAHQHAEHRGHGEAHVHPVLVDDLEDALGRELRDVGRRAARQQRQQHRRGDPERVEEGQHAQEHPVLGDPDVPQAALHVDHEVAMREHHALRQAHGARRVEDGGRVVVPAGRHERPGGRRERVLDVDGLGAQRLHHALEVPRGDHRVEARVLGHEADGLRIEQEVERHGHLAGEQDAEVGDGERGAGGGDEAHVIAVGRLAHGGAHGLCGGEHLAVGMGAHVVEHSLLVGQAPRGVHEPASQVHRHQLVSRSTDSARSGCAPARSAIPATRGSNRLRSAMR